MKKIIRLTEGQLHKLIEQTLNELKKGVIRKPKTYRLNRDGSYPRAYNDDQYEAAYENALMCLYYGYGKSHWNSCGLPPEEAQEVWDDAFDYMGNLED